MKPTTTSSSGTSSAPSSIARWNPDAPEYVCLYENKKLADFDPVEQMARGIEWTTGDQSA